ncbi:MAG: transglutaminase-like domain-containing protein [Dehalococcoidia bacterium]|nr:transglutaminase-like domain-containing protein [Dehalococcoidia bacterium]
MDSSIQQDFQTATRGADQAVDLFGAAMVIARLREGARDPNEVARELDLLAEDVRRHAGDGAGPEELAQAIDHELFAVRGFHGNSGDYAAPENSYLDVVVERRTGIPITLSLVYMEVAQRVGLRCDPVGYPSHFIVRCGDPESPIYVDPFNQGVRLDRAELLAQLHGLNLNGAHPESFLAAITRRQVLQRMLNNLHAVFRTRRDLERWLAVVELHLVLEPWNAQLVGERGMLHYRLGRPSQALSDLERYVTASEPRTVSSGALRLLDELRLRYGGNEEES